MIDFLKQKKSIIVAILCVIAFGGIYFLDLNKDYNTIEESQDILINNTPEDKEKEDAEETLIVIHIAGAVRKPGIVKLTEGSRIEDAIEKADGLTDDADISNVNLAYILEDGTKIKIPRIGDEDVKDEYTESIITEGESSKKATIKSKSTKLNINTATVEDFQTLDGIGPSLANRIFEYRKANGKFKSIEDIKNVSGIGENKFEKIKDYIKV